METVESQKLRRATKSWSLERKTPEMLKITRVAESNEQITLHLDGSVTGQWIELLRTSAEAVLDQGLQLVVDLEHICFIDCEGLALIKSLISRGGRQVNAPLFVADQLRKCEGERND